jgi:hypothetical protein
MLSGAGSSTKEQERLQRVIDPNRLDSVGTDIRPFPATEPIGPGGHAGRSLLWTIRKDPGAWIVLLVVIFLVIITLAYFNYFGGSSDRSKPSTDPSAVQRGDTPDFIYEIENAQSLGERLPLPGNSLEQQPPPQPASKAPRGDKR